MKIDPMHRKRWRLVRAGFLILMTVILVQACGLKADPAPRQLKPLKPLTDLSLRKNAGGIFVQWRIREQNNRMTHFRIMRSEFAENGQGCQGCPPDEIRIADLTAGEAQLATGEANGFGYRDMAIRSGRTYRYRVTGCDRSGFCSDPSMPAMLILPDETIPGGGVDIETDRNK